LTLHRLVFPTLLGVVGVAILLALGFWQVERLAWKEGLIADIEARLAADPVSLPAEPDPDRDRLLRVDAMGRIDAEEIHVLSSLDPWGAGYRVISPMTLEDGRRVLVDLGFVPQDRKNLGTRSNERGEGVAGQVTGLLLWPNETDRFTPAPDRGRNIWFARDVPLMASELGTESVMIVAETHSLPEWPKPAPPGTNLPNRHLGYAITWFGLAIVWAAMTVWWIVTRLRGGSDGGSTPNAEKSPAHRASSLPGGRS
jgi:surfeit locus 1 family protein